MLKLTKKQAEIVSWAIEPMHDYWCTEAGADERDGPMYDVSDLPVLCRRTLTLSTVRDINEDLVYRIGVQLPDMARVELGGRHDVRSCEILTKMIEQQIAQLFGKSFENLFDSL